DMISSRPLGGGQITIRERETGSTLSLASDAQGRVTVEQLNPALYSVSAAGSGIITSSEPAVRVVTRKTLQLAFELLREQTLTEEVLVRARQADTFSSASSTYLDREALRSAVGGGADPLLS